MGAHGVERGGDTIVMATREADNGDIDRTIAAALDKLTQVQRILLWDIAKHEKLSPIQIQFLLHLQRYPDALRTVSVLAREFDLTKATVSDALSALEDKGIIARERDEADRRSHIVRLTAKGARLADRVGPWQDALVRHIGRLPRADRERLLGSLMTLIKSLHDDGVISVARMCIACENFVRGRDGEPHRCVLAGHAIAEADLSIGCAHYRSASTG